MDNLVGSNIDPRLFLYDYSGHTNAANAVTNGVTGAINAVGGQLKDYAKEQKDAKNALKASQAQIDAAITLFPDQADRLTKISSELKNEDAPLTERAAMASSVAELIAMGVGEKRYQTEQEWKQKDYDFMKRDQDLQERESNLRQMATSYDIKAAEKGFAQADMDQKTKETIGGPLLDSVLAMAPESLSTGIKDNLAKGQYSDADKYSLANSITALIPKSERVKAPAVQDVAVPGGTQKVQFDDTTGKWIPIQVAGPASSGDPTVPDLPIYTPIDASDADLSQILPPIQGTPDVIMPGGAVNRGAPPVGFVPSSADPAVAKQQAAAKVVAEKKVADIAKSQQLLTDLDQLEKHPGFSNLFGTNIGVPTWVAGSDAADAKTIFNKVKGSGFLEAVQALKGMGALTEIEGAKATDAFLGLSPSMSEAAAKKQIESLKKTVADGIKRSAQGLQTAPVTETDPFKAATDKLRSFIK